MKTPALHPTIMSSIIYLVASTGMPRSHHAIFIEENENGSGRIYQVVGDIQNGMSFETKLTEPPERSATFESKTRFGMVTAVNKSQIELVCNSVPPPKKQIYGPKRLFPNEPVRRCQEWTKEAVEVLRVARALQE